MAFHGRSRKAPTGAGYRMNDFIEHCMSDCDYLALLDKAL